MKFKTIYNFENNYVSCSGTIVEDVDKTSGEKVRVSGRRYTYKVDFDKRGKRNLIINGTEDVYGYIQSFKEDTDIYRILQRLNGDITKLDKNKGFYADLSSIPKDFYEFHNKIEEGQRIFAGLPTDLKSKFGNSINEFMNSIYNKDFEVKYNDYVSSKLKRSNNVVDNNVNNNKSDVSEVSNYE